MFELKFDETDSFLCTSIGAALVNFGNGDVTKIGPRSPVDNSATEVSSHAGVTTDEKIALTEAATGTTGNDQPADVNNAETSTVEQDTTQQTAGAVSNAPAGNATDNLDEFGVGFNPAYCSKAAVPFNQTGRKKGQWKRRQGVDENAYDAWHAESRAAITAEPVAEQQIDTAAAFQNGEQQQSEQGPPTFKDGGEFLGWVSEQQAAELLTQQNVNDAYVATGNELGDLFNPAKAESVIAAVYAYLAPIAAPF